MNGAFEAVNCFPAHEHAQLRSPRGLTHLTTPSRAGTPASPQPQSPQPAEQLAVAASAPGSTGHSKPAPSQAAGEPATPLASTTSAVPFSSPGTSVTVVTNAAIPFAAGSAPGGACADDAFYSAHGPTDSMPVQRPPHVAGMWDTYAAATLEGAFPTLAAPATHAEASSWFAGGDGQPRRSMHTEQEVQHSHSKPIFTPDPPVGVGSYGFPEGPSSTSQLGPAALDASASGSHQQMPNTFSEQTEAQAAASQGSLSSVGPSAAAVGEVLGDGASAAPHAAVSAGGEAGGFGAGTWVSHQPAELQHPSTLPSSEVCQVEEAGRVQQAVSTFASSSAVGPTCMQLQAQPWATQLQPQVQPQHAAFSTSELQRISTSLSRNVVPLASTSLADVFGGPSTSSPDWSSSFLSTGLADGSPAVRTTTTAVTAPHQSPFPISATPSAAVPWTPVSAAPLEQAVETPAARQPDMPSDAHSAAWFQQPHSQKADGNQTSVAAEQYRANLPVHAIVSPQSLWQPSQDSLNAGSSHIFPQVLAPALGETPSVAEARVVEAESCAHSHPETRRQTQPLTASHTEYEPSLPTSTASAYPWSPEPASWPAAPPPAQASPQRQSATEAAVFSSPEPQPEQHSQQHTPARSGGRFAWLWGSGKARAQPEPEPYTEHEFHSGEQQQPITTESNVPAAHGHPPASADYTALLPSLDGTQGGSGVQAEPHSFAQAPDSHGDASPSALHASDRASEWFDRAGLAAKEATPLVPWQLSPSNPSVSSAAAEAASGASHGRHPGIVGGHAYDGHVSAEGSYNGHSTSATALSARQPGDDSTAQGASHVPESDEGSGQAAAAAKTSALEQLAAPLNSLGGSQYGMTAVPEQYSVPFPGEDASRAAWTAPHAEHLTATAAGHTSIAADPVTSVSTSTYRPPWLEASAPTSLQPSAATDPAFSLGAAAPMPAAPPEPTTTQLPPTSAKAPIATAAAGAAPAAASAAVSSWAESAPTANQRSFLDAVGKPEPSYLESYLDNLLGMGSKRGASGQAGQQYSLSAADGDAALSRRVSSSGGAAAAPDDSSTALRRTSSTGGGETAEPEAPGSTAQHEDDGLGSGDRSTGSLGGAQPNGLPPRPPQTGMHKRLGSEESLSGQDGRWVLAH